MSTSTILPASGNEYVCFHNPKDPARFVQVRIIAWVFKSDDAQPEPITSFGKADMTRPVPIAQHWPTGDEHGFYYLTPNGPFFVDPPSGRSGPRAHEQMRHWLSSEQPPERI